MPSDNRTVIETLRASVAKVTQSGDPSFDAERERVVWNRRFAGQRSPTAIATVHSTEDVAEAIRVAREHGLTVSVRGGGHNYEAAALRDDTLLLDLGALDSIAIDRGSKTARVGVGVKDGPLIEELAAAGFAFPVGHCSDVSLSGYLLSGGFGWNAGEWGPACANVIAIEIVTASGEIVEANAEQHPDLFFAARGHGPGFFAAITGYTLALHPLPATAFECGGTFPLSAARQVAEWLDRAIDGAAPDVEIGALLTIDSDSGEPSILVRATACGDNEDDARRKVESFGKPPPDIARLADPTSEALPFTGLFRFSHMPSGKRVAADHVWTDATVGDALLALRGVPPPNAASSLNIVAFGGHTPIPLPRDAALSLTGRTGVGIYGMWDEPADDERISAWVAQADDALAPLRKGRYVGEAALTVDPGRRAECFTPEALARLETLRAEYDPEGVFARWP